MEPEEDKTQTASNQINSTNSEMDIQVIQDTTLPETAMHSLMPELEELVKKNPNRLIGCGG